MSLVPNTPSKIFTITAFMLGYILIDEATPAEQNSLGNWFMLIGQVLCTNSAQQQVINNRTGNSTLQNQHVINDTFGSDFSNEDINAGIEDLNNVIQAMQKEIDILKTKIKP